MRSRSFHSSTRFITLVIVSRRSGVIARPSALSTPACGGTITRSTPSISASPHAWSGPPPPNAINVHERGSIPRSTLTRRSARAIVASAVAMIACAVRASVSPNFRANAVMLSRAPALFKATPPLILDSVIRFSATCASVTVACVPPLLKATGPGTTPALCGPT